MRKISSRMHKGMDGFFYFIVLLSVSISILLLSIFKISSQDTYLHLKAGEYIAQNLKIPYTDIFSYTAFGKPWVYHEWLFGVIIHLIYSLSSLEFLSILAALLIFTTFSVLYKLVVSLGTNLYLASVIIMGAILGSKFCFSLRPHQVSYLFIVIFLYILKDKNSKKVWLLPFFLVLWSNIHAGCVYGVILIGLDIVGDVIDEAFKNRSFHVPLWRNRGQHITIILISLAACLLNPYTYRIFTYPWEIMQLNTSQFTISVTEWRQTTFLNHPYFFLSLLTLVLLFIFNYRKVKATDILLVLAFGYLGVRVERGVGEFLLVTSPILGRHGQLFIDSLRKSFPLVFPTQLRRIISLAFCLSIIHTGIANIEKHGEHQWGLGMNKEIVPVQAVRFLEAAGIGGNMYNSYDYGGYIIWLNYPNRFVFIDGRHDVHADYLRKAAYLGYEDLAKYYNLNYMILRNAKHVSEIPSRDRWALVYWGNVGRVYLLRNERNARLIEKYEDRFIQPDKADFSYLNPYIHDPLIREALIAEINKSIVFDSGNLNAHIAMAYVYSNSGAQYWENAVHEYEEAIRIRPDAAFLHNSIGVIYKQIERGSDAEREFKRAIDLDPDYSQPYHNLIELYTKSGELENAKLYKKRLRRHLH